MPSAATAASSARQRCSSASSAGGMLAPLSAGHALDPGDGANRHQPGDDRDVDAGGARALDEVEIDAIVEEKLGDDEVEAGVDLGLEVPDVLIEVAALHVPLGVAGAAQAERVAEALADVVHQVGGVREAARHALEARLAGRRIAAQHHDVLDAGVDQPLEHRADLVLAGADAGQVGHRREARLALDPLHQLDGLGARRAARAVGHRHEGRRQLGELAGSSAPAPGRRRRSWAGRTRTRTSGGRPPGTARRSSLARSPTLPRLPPMRSRCAAIAAASTVTVSPLRSGASNMTSWQISSTIVRRLRAPVRRRRQYCAIDRRPSSEKRRSTPSIFKQRLVLAHHRVGRTGHDQVQVVLGQRLAARHARAGGPGTRPGSRSRAAPSRSRGARARRRPPDRRRSRRAWRPRSGEGRRRSPPR